MDLWFNPLTVHSYENNVIILATNSEFKYSKVKEKYLSEIKDAFESFFGFEQDVDIIFTGEPTSPEKIQKQLGIGEYSYLRNKAQEAAQKTEEPENTAAQNSDNVISPAGVLPIDYSFQYTFDNFIVVKLSSPL